MKDIMETYRGVRVPVWVTKAVLERTNLWTLSCDSHAQLKFL